MKEMKEIFYKMLILTNLFIGIANMFVSSGNSIIGIQYTLILYIIGFFILLFYNIGFFKLLLFINLLASFINIFININYMTNMTLNIIFVIIVLITYLASKLDFISFKIAKRKLFD